MHMGKRLVIAAVALAAGIGILGCGDDDSSSDEKPQPTKAQFLKQADAVCASGNRQLESAGRTFFKPGVTEADFVEKKVAPIFTTMLGKLDALRPPEGDDAQIDRLIRAGRQGLDKLKADPDSIKAPPGSAKDPFRDFGKQGKKYGLRCGGG
jgi:hypothetical protein